MLSARSMADAVPAECPVILKNVENIEGRNITSDYISPRHSFESLDIHIPKWDIWTRDTPPFNGISVYTDVSKMESGT